MRSAGSLFPVLKIPCKSIENIAFFVPSKGLDVVEFMRV
jgi:hypothetical protein